MIKYLSWVSALIMVINGCSATTTQKAPVVGTVASSALKIQLMPRCIINQKAPEAAIAAGAFLAPIVVSLANVIIDGTTNALIAAGQPETINYPLIYSYEFYEFDPYPESSA